MTNEEIVKEIEESIKLINQTKTTVNDALCHARNVVEKDDKAIKEAYNKGLEDAWNFVKKTGDMQWGKFNKIYNCEWEDMFKCFTPQDAIAKLEVYEKNKMRLKWEM